MFCVMWRVCAFIDVVSKQTGTKCRVGGSGPSCHPAVPPRPLLCVSASAELGPRVSLTDGALTKGLQAGRLHTRLNLNGSVRSAAPALRHSIPE